MIPSEIHPQIHALLDAAAKAGIPKIADMSPDQARSVVEKMAEARRGQYPPPKVFSVKDMRTGTGYGDLPVRVYRSDDTEDAPVMVFFHGGGHVFGSLDTHDTVCRHLCRTARCTVVSVDYRMGPEHRFPAAVNDAWQATRWVAESAQALCVDPVRIAVCGDSAGGNLAAVISIMARDAGQFEISAQCLVYPITDYRGGTGSYTRYATGFGILEAASMQWFRDHYFEDAAQASDWRASPMLATSLADLPPTLMLTAGCDVLRDEGLAYANMLASAGVAVDQVTYAGMVHGFFGYLGLADETERAHAKVAEFLRKIWN